MLKKLNKFFSGKAVEPHTTMLMSGIMSAFHKPVGSANENNAMLVRMSRQNLAEWKAEKASWETIGKKPTRKDKITARNKQIRIAQDKKKKERERKKESDECLVEWSDVF